MERAALIECWASELQTAAGAVCTANVLDSYCDDALQALRVCDTSGTDAGPPAHCDGVAASAGELRVAVVPTPTSFDLLCVVDSESAQLMATRSSTGSTVDISLLGPGRGSVTTGQVGELSVVAAGTRSSGASFRCANDSGDLCTVCTALEGGKLVGTVHCPGLVCDDGAPPLALDASFHCP
jgi:hypothetical protein